LFPWLTADRISKKDPSFFGVNETYSSRLHFGISIT